MKKVPFSALVTPMSISLTTIEGKAHVIHKDHRNYDQIVTIIKSVFAAQEAGDKDAADELHASLTGLCDLGKIIREQNDSQVTIQDGIVFYNGEPVNNAVTGRIIWGLSEGFNMNPYIRFLEKVMQNPSMTAVDELYQFMEKNGMGIHADGDIIAYKKVLGNFRDIYTGRFDNSPGKILEMRRNGVDDNRTKTCSKGFHFCAMSYLPHYGVASGNKIVLVKVNPKDVVSIPIDYNFAKARCCRYEVIAEYTGDDRDDLLATKAVWDDEDFYEGDWDDFVTEDADAEEIDEDACETCTIGDDDDDNSFIEVIDFSPPEETAPKTLEAFYREKTAERDEPILTKGWLNGRNINTMVFAEVCQVGYDEDPDYFGLYISKFGEEEGLHWVGDENQKFFYDGSSYSFVDESVNPKVIWVILRPENPMVKKLLETPKGEGTDGVIHDAELPVQPYEVAEQTAGVPGVIEPVVDTEMDLALREVAKILVEREAAEQADREADAKPDVTLTSPEAVDRIQQILDGLREVMKQEVAPKVEPTPEMIGAAIFAEEFAKAKAPGYLGGDPIIRASRRIIDMYDPAKTHPSSVNLHDTDKPFMNDKTVWEEVGLLATEMSKAKAAFEEIETLKIRLSKAKIDSFVRVEGDTFDSAGVYVAKTFDEDAFLRDWAGQKMAARSRAASDNAKEQ
jgi:hypothetical protein